MTSLARAQSHAMFQLVCWFLRKKDKKGQTVYKICPLVEYAAFFWDLGKEYINQTEMVQYRVVSYIFNDYNLCRPVKPTKASVIPVWRIFSDDQSKRRITNTPSLTTLQKLLSVSSLKEWVPVLNRMECESSGNKMFVKLTDLVRIVTVIYHWYFDILLIMMLELWNACKQV